MENLPYKYARMLSYWNDRPINFVVPYYAIHTYGEQICNITEKFLNWGFLRLTNNKEKLEKSSVSDLKKCLKATSEKVSGSKSELIQRILENCSEEIINKYFASYYTLTEKGQEQLKNNELYFRNDRLQYDLTIFEIKNFKDKNPELTDFEILKSIFENKISQTYNKKKWNEYGKYLKHLYMLEIEYDSFEDALFNLWKALCYNLSGLEVNPYTNERQVKRFSNLFLDIDIIKGFDTCINCLNLSIESLCDIIKNDFYNKTPTLPFSYFLKSNILKILCDKLIGEEFSPLNCKYIHNTPKTNSEDYIYYG